MDELLSGNVEEFKCVNTGVVKTEVIDLNDDSDHFLEVSVHEMQKHRGFPKVQKIENRGSIEIEHPDGIQMPNERVKFEVDENNFATSDENSELIPSRRHSKRPRRAVNRKLTLEEKLQVVWALENPASTIATVARDFGLPESTINNILKEREQLIHSVDDLEEEREEKLIVQEENSQQEMDMKNDVFQETRIEASSKSLDISVVKSDPVDKIPELCLTRIDSTDKMWSVKEEIAHPSDIPASCDQEDLSISEESRVPSSIEDRLSNTKVERVKRTRKALTLEDKLKLIEKLDLGISPSVLARNYNIHRTTVSSLRQKRHSIELSSNSPDIMTNGKHKRFRITNSPELDRCLFLWYQAVRQQSGKSDNEFFISGRLLKAKSCELSTAMGKPYFPKLSWITRWRERHNLKQKCHQSHRLTGLIDDEETLKKLEENIDMQEIFQSVESMTEQLIKINKVPRASNAASSEVPLPLPGDMYVCEHCGVEVQLKQRVRDKNLNYKGQKKAANHLPGCPSAPARKHLTLAEKIKVIRAMEKPGAKKTHVGKQFGVSRCTVAQIFEKRESFLSKAQHSYHLHKKKLKQSRHPDLDEALYAWWKAEHEQGLSHTAATLGKKAREISLSLGKDYIPSGGWLHRWKVRYDLDSVTGSGGSHGNTETPENIEKDCDLELVEDTNMECDTEIESAEEKPTCDDHPNLQQSSVSTQGGWSNHDGVNQFDQFIKSNNWTNHKDKRKKPKRKAEPRNECNVVCSKCGCATVGFNVPVHKMNHTDDCTEKVRLVRKSISNETRLQVLNALKAPGANFTNVARLFDIDRVSVSNIKKNEKQVLADAETFGGGSKRNRQWREPEVGEKLYDYFVMKRKQGVHLTITMLQEVGHKIAKDMGRQFKPTDGWISRWKTRYDLVGVGLKYAAIKKRKKFVELKKVNGKTFSETTDDIDTEIGKSEVEMPIKDVGENPERLESLRFHNSLSDIPFSASSHSQVNPSIIHTNSNSMIESMDVDMSPHKQNSHILHQNQPQNVSLPHNGDCSKTISSSSSSSSFQSLSNNIGELPMQNNVPLDSDPTEDCGDIVDASSSFGDPHHPEQQLEVMEALKIMKTFVQQQQGLGQDVHKALQKIETSVKQLNGGDN